VRKLGDNRDLMTGLVVALLYGPVRDPWSGWERYKQAGAHRRSNFHGMAGIAKWVGRPSVVISPKWVKLGLTEFAIDYVPRAEQLAAKRAAKQARAT